MIRKTFFTLCFALLFIIQPCFGIPIQFPPNDGPYTGDYVLISEPGRYTLEHNITHTYPVGVIITSSSVILDGQEFQIKPASTGGPSVGIWVSLLDAKGEPVTGVRIQNLTILDEVSGIYLEGTDSSEFPWGSDRTSDEKMKNAQEFGRDIKTSGVTITGSRIGMVSKDLAALSIWQSEIRNNEIGLQIIGGIPDIRDVIISDNSGIGLHLQKTSGGDITGCRIEGNHGPGILLDQTTGVHIWNNILDNLVNIKNNESEGTTLFHPLLNQTNIIKGDLTGGNLWAMGGIPVYVSHKITDVDHNGIGDIPYTEAGLIDQYTLVPSGTGYSPPETDAEPVEQVPVTHTPVPVSTPLSIITGIHAIIIGDTIPSEMQTKTSYPVTITIFNDGSDDWLDMHAVGIKATDQAATSGPEWLVVPSIVKSKQSYTFNFELMSPSTPGTYELSYQAARGGQGVSVTFGRPYKKVITVK